MFRLTLGHAASARNRQLLKPTSSIRLLIELKEASVAIFSTFTNKFNDKFLTSLTSETIPFLSRNGSAIFKACLPYVKDVFEKSAYMVE